MALDNGLCPVGDNGSTTGCVGDYDGTLTSLGRTDEVSTLQDAIDAILIPGNVDTFATPGNVDLTATPWVRRIRCALAPAASTLVITHPLLTTTSYMTGQLEGSSARVFSFTYAAGSATLTTSSNTALAINVYIHSF